jgi:hypothetical protein
MPSDERKEEWVPIARPRFHGVPLDELEDRLETQAPLPMETAVVCYTDFCPTDCGLHCASGYSGCTDLCACDGSMCAAECGSLCVADSCLVDIF